MAGKLKLGEKCRNPADGEIGRVVRFRDGKAIGRDSEGRAFVAVPVGGHRKGKPPGAKARVRVKGSHLIYEGVYVKSSRVRIITPHPVWFGCVVTRKDAEFLEEA